MLRKRPNKSKNVFRKGNKSRGDLPFYKQIREVDLFVIDDVIVFTDNISFAIDVFTSISGALDYTNQQVLYGEFKWLSLQLHFMPFLVAPILATDVASGSIAVRQGVFNAAPAFLGFSGATSLPGSRLINNCKPFSLKVPLTNSVWYSSSATNTAVSIVPKLNMFVGYANVASTNTNKGIMNIRVTLACKSKLE